MRKKKLAASFAPYAHGDIPKARDRAVEAVLSW